MASKLDDLQLFSVNTKMKGVNIGPSTSTEYITEIKF
jgi:hypothetical protein